MNIPLKSVCRALYLNNDSVARHESKLVSTRLLTSHCSLLFLILSGGITLLVITESAQCIQHFCNRSFLMSSNIDKQEPIIIMQRRNIRQRHGKYIVQCRERASGGRGEVKEKAMHLHTVNTNLYLVVLCRIQFPAFCNLNPHTQ